jgi:glycosyltransferase involved in cell wall biosynthesis
LPHNAGTAVALDAVDAVSDPARLLVSCIIIFLNEEKYLAEAIESVLAQTYHNWELLLVDDGSTDGSASIARAYCSKNPQRIRYFAHENRANRGMSASRNLGLREARGSLVAFLDGDDTWFDDKLERQVAIFHRHPEAVMVSGATLYWHSWRADADRPDRIICTGHTKTVRGSSTGRIAQERLYQPGELMKELYPLGKGVTPSSSGNMIRRDFALAVGGFEESFTGLFEDQVFRAKAYLAGPIYVSSAVFDRYRQHRESCCYVTRAAGQSDALRGEFLTWLKGYLDETNCRDPVIRAKLWFVTLQQRYPKVSQLPSKVRRRLSRMRRR